MKKETKKDNLKNTKNYIKKENKNDPKKDIKNDSINNKKKSNKSETLKIRDFTGVKWLIAIVFFIVSVGLVLAVNSLNIVPNKYLIIGSVLLLSINTIANLCLFSEKKWPKIITIIIHILIIAISIIGIHFSYVANDFLNKAFNNAEKTYQIKFSIFSNEIIDEKSLDKKEVYYYKDAIHINDAINKLKEKYNIEFKSLDDLAKVFEQKTFLVDESTFNMFVEDFELDSSKLHPVTSIELEYEMDTEEQPEEEQPEEESNDKDKKEETKKKKSNNSDHYYNIFLGGYDFSGRRMDMNKLITINTKTNEILITNLHRYTYLDVPGYNQKNTLSSMSVYGLKNNVKAIEKLLDIKINYYLVARTEGLVKLVDDVGGINYCSNLEFTTVHAKVIGTYDDSVGDKVHISKGCQHLDGIETLTVARERLAFEMGAVERDKNTTNIMLDILEQMKKPANISKYTTILNDVSGMYTTSIPRDLITKSVKQLLNKGWSIKTNSIRGKNGRDRVHFSNVKGSVMYPSASSVNQAKSKINALDK